MRILKKDVETIEQEGYLGDGTNMDRKPKLDQRPISSMPKRVSQAAFTSGRRKPRRRDGMALNRGENQ